MIYFDWNVFLLEETLVTIVIAASVGGVVLLAFVLAIVLR